MPYKREFIKKHSLIITWSSRTAKVLENKLLNFVGQSLPQVFDLRICISFVGLRNQKNSVRQNGLEVISKAAHICCSSLKSMNKYKQVKMHTCMLQQIDLREFLSPQFICLRYSTSYVKVANSVRITIDFCIIDLLLVCT